MSDSTLGFRHGPKTIINGRTLVVVMLSNDAYARAYDRDLLAELDRDGRAGGMLALGARPMARRVERLGYSRHGRCAGLELALLHALVRAELRAAAVARARPDARPAGCGRRRSTASCRA